MRSHFARPNLNHSHPMMTAVAKEATNLATTICGCPGKATNVETSTIGLIAGAERRKASAAAGVTPLAMSDPATGTEAHSQPGRRSPAAPATGTAATRFAGSARCQNSLGTNAAIAAERRTPRTRNGRA